VAGKESESGLVELAEVVDVLAIVGMPSTERIVVVAEST
jgi:hypothetical protein